MKLTGRLPAPALLCDGVLTSTMLDIFGDHVAELDALQGQSIDIEIKPHRERRSLSANALCWELCSQIGRAILPPIAKEDVYRSAIRAVGEYVQVCIRKEDWPRFRQTWSTQGVGWFAEIIDGSEVMGHIDVMAYAGTSTYDTRAMSTLIDYLVDEAQQMELPIGHELAEIEKIKNNWANKKEAKTYDEADQTSR